MSKHPARWFIAIAIVTLLILGARASPGAESNGVYSNASLNGTFVFRDADNAPPISDRRHDWRLQFAQETLDFAEALVG